MLEAASSEHARVVLRARVRTVGESGGKVPLKSLLLQSVSRGHLSMVSFSKHLPTSPDGKV